MKDGNKRKWNGVRSVSGDKFASGAPSDGPEAKQGGLRWTGCVVPREGGLPEEGEMRGSAHKMRNEDERRRVTSVLLLI